MVPDRYGCHGRTNNVRRESPSKLYIIGGVDHETGERLSSDYRLFFLLKLRQILKLVYGNWKMYVCIKGDRIMLCLLLTMKSGLLGVY